MGIIYPIINDILAGMLDAGQAKVMEGRAEAVTNAVMQAKENDVVLVAGKGHEDRPRLFGARVIVSNDHDVGKFFRDSAHQRTFTFVAVAAAAEDAPQLAAIRLTRWKKRCRRHACTAAASCGASSAAAATATKVNVR